MIYIAVLAPFSIAYAVGAPALSVLGIIGLFLGVTLGVGLTPGVITGPDIASATVSTLLAASQLALLLYVTCWVDLEAYFSSLPWLHLARSAQAKGRIRKYQIQCPFTGLRPDMRCPSCECRVHRTAFHQRDRLVGLMVGENVLRWDLARAATQADGDVDKARAVLDRALDLRGNMFTNAVTECCTGCATWHKCFNLLPRLALSLSLASLVAAYGPWGFASFLDSSAGKAGTALQVILDVAGVSYGLGAVLVQVAAILRANAWLDRHQAALPAVRPLLALPRHGPLARVAGWFLAPPWEHVP